MAHPELVFDEVSVVVRGAFEPGALTPQWLHHRGLIGSAEVNDAQIKFLTPELSEFHAMWFDFQMMPDVLQLETQDAAEFERVRDIAAGVLRDLEGVAAATAVGINRKMHFEATGAPELQKIFERLAPKDPWNGVLERPGMASITVRGVRPDDYPGHVQVQVEPSPRVRPGLRVAVNDHFDLTGTGTGAGPAGSGETAPAAEEKTSEASEKKTGAAVDILVDQWAPSMRRAETMANRLVGQEGRAHEGQRTHHSHGHGAASSEPGNGVNSRDRKTGGEK